MNTITRAAKLRGRAVERVEAVQQRTFRLLEGEASRPGRIISLTLLNLIVLNLIAVILETVPGLSTRFGIGFPVFESVSVAIFSVEYVLRVWSCTSNPKYRRPVWGRLRFALTPLALVDFIAIVPAYLPVDVFVDMRYARVLRLVRLLRVLKLTRYSRTLRTFTNVVGAKAWDLGMIAFFLGVFLVVASVSMYFVEHQAQPEVFSSVPSAMWWAVVTLTTVGYGDIYPITPLGKFLGSIIALIGIGFFALPAGLLAAGFAEEIHRERDAKKHCPHCGKEL